MGKINILPAKVYNRIAAGEVVDRPCSVVKELIENSIDAGATEIEIWIEQGGKQSIRVIDNGCGIERDDLQSAFLPHATSKISKAEDLDQIMTLGFRGEALASIASVSRMSIISKTKGGKCYGLKSFGGELENITEEAGGNGTDVYVETLFFNTPVRAKFLRSDKAEETEITNFVTRFILNRPNIAFTYYVDEKKVLQSFGDGMDSAFVSVYGANTFAQCYKIDAQRNGLRLRGFIGNQNFSKANKSYQSLFLNGRYIVNTTISAAITKSYQSYLMKRQYPFYVLHLDVPTEIVDVNVHPNKADVRFADNNIIFGTVTSIISAVLDGQPKGLEYIVNAPQETDWAVERISAPVVEQAIEESKTDKDEKTDTQKVFGLTTLTYEEAQKEIEQAAPSFKKETKRRELPFKTLKEEQNRKGFIPMDQIPDYEFPKLTLEERMEEHQRLLDWYKTKEGAKALKIKERFPNVYFNPPAIKVKEGEEKIQKPKRTEEEIFAENKRIIEVLTKKFEQERIDITTCTYVGKLFNTYLMYERKDVVYIIDQHAAHERLIFNRLREQMRNRSAVKQTMIVPFELSLNAYESGFFRERLQDLLDIGFDVEEGENNLFRITAVPVDLQSIDLTAFFNEFLADINGYRAIRLEELLKDKLATAACKAAVKGGMDLTSDEIDALFTLMDGNMSLKCPHGRPVVITMKKREIEKMFKRIV
ncbi:MAG: DNA mismatch repair endonuclease MutL [Clostridia bacterium]|nr:DNA mismatch repair endonuclease MutL [Clostridia bacterium]